MQFLQPIIRMTDNQFRQPSLQFNTSIDKDDRKEQGIFFTPKNIRTRLFEVLARHATTVTNILEPSFGSGEFVLDATERYPQAEIVGVEKHSQMCNAAMTTMAGRTMITLRNLDFLDFPNQKFDLVIGNPPYFVTKAKNPACMTGRGNIFVQFIYKCLTDNLLPNGLLAFVIPTSFYNCSYYQPCRDYIIKHTTILHLENLDGGFYDTSQGTMLMVLRNTPPSSENQPYSFTLHGCRYLSPNYKELTQLTTSTTTLSALGFAVKTGDVVWNQEKSNLHETQGKLVIYMSNIVNNTLILNNFVQRGKMPNEKKQRIKSFSRATTKGPAILVARGYGNAQFKLSYVYVSETFEEFYGENHVNVITATTPAAKNNFQRILNSFADERTSRFLAMFVGNYALSKTELEDVLPIF
jgi:type I restriction-modification system DNA methylase subunit